MKFLASNAGKIKLTAMMLGVSEMEAIVIFKEREAEVGSLIALVIRQSLRIKADAPATDGEAAPPADSVPN
jgi:hypothetical protein